MNFTLSPKEYWEITLPDGDAFQIQTQTEPPSLEPFSIPEKKTVPLRALSQRLEAINGFDFLHVDIRTPFGEDVNETQVLGAMDEALGPHRNLYRLIGYLLLRIEETHMGSSHRIILFLSKVEFPLHFLRAADRKIPIELGVLGLGIRCARQLRYTRFQIAVCHKGIVYSLLMVGGEPHHLLRCDSSTSPRELQRIRDHRRAFPRQENANEEIIPFIAFGWDLSTLNSLFSELHPQLGNNPGLIKIPESTPSASNAALALGLYEMECSGFAVGVDLSVTKERTRLRELRLGRVMVSQSLLFFLFVLLGAVALGWQIYQSEKKELSLQASASMHQLEVQSLQSLRKKIQVQKQKFLTFGPLTSPAVMWSPILAQIANATPTGGGITALLARHETDGSMSVSIQAWTRVWNQVEIFRSQLDSLPGTEKVDITEQRKNPSSGTIAFQMQIKIAHP